MGRKETWLHIFEFEDYAVSDLGNVINNNSNLMLRQHVNQQGIPAVHLYRDRRQYVRSVSLLVAQAFLPPHKFDWFDTPINVDGNRLNNCVENLMWRPRWFAVKYHKERKDGVRTRRLPKVYNVETEEVFEELGYAAMKYGLLESDILEGAFNKEIVSPGGIEFRFLPDNDLGYI